MTKAAKIGYLVLAVIFFIYSYGFVDLNLTLSSNPILFGFVSFMQKLVYFNRADSTNLFVGLTAAVTALYATIVYREKKAGPSYVFPWKYIAVIACVFALSYPALSSDVFKYLFSARMIVEYGANPHTVTPDTFSSDTWIRFMRWVHTPSPYGPVFTLSAIPYYILGLGKFVPTLYLYKVGQIGWYLLTVWLIGKLTKSVRAQLFVALNPLILIEWLMNAHNDAPMMALLLLSVYLAAVGRRALSFAALALSAGIKYVTGIFLPFLFLKKQNTKIIGYVLTAAFFIIPLLYKYTFQYQPWYVTWLVPFAALTGQGWIWFLVSSYAFGSLLRYIPFISTGLWSATPLEFALLSFSPLVCAAVLMAVRYALVKKRNSA